MVAAQGLPVWRGHAAGNEGQQRLWLCLGQFRAECQPLVVIDSGIHQDRIEVLLPAECQRFNATGGATERQRRALSVVAE